MRFDKLLKAFPMGDFMSTPFLEARNPLVVSRLGFSFSPQV